MDIDLYTMLQQEIRPALGCTEPAAVALACALAAHRLDGEVTRVTVGTDPNVYKNGMGVYLPGTGETGLLFAAALGAVAGRPELELQVLVDCASKLEQARQLIEAGKVEVTPSQAAGTLSIVARVETSAGYAIAQISGSHTNLTRLVVNGETIHEQEECGRDAEPGPLAASLRDYPLWELIAECHNLVAEAYSHVLAAAKGNQEVAKSGLAEELGLGLGYHYQELINRRLMGNDLANQAMAATAAAADARMSGVDKPVWSTNGSGNQGITASLPVLTVGQALGKSDQELAVALTISQVVTVYVKQHIGKLSALCACALAAAIGASCGVVYLLGGDYGAMEEAIKVMVANLTGMICDGAKISCSLKLATAANTAVLAALLATNGLATTVADGIIGNTAEETIRNLGTVSNPGMVETDRVILDVMLHKQNS
ncbi:MAG: serine dehydratase subunit alpha family protein [Bacillota bacterium]|jgi:L-cysteine desulfidase